MDCFFGGFISQKGVTALHGFIIPVAMTCLYIPLAGIEITILNLFHHKLRILKFIFYFQLIGFPIGILGLYIYNVVEGIK